jgi:hypothetical protein
VLGAVELQVVPLKYEIVHPAGAVIWFAELNEVFDGSIFMTISWAITPEDEIGALAVKVPPSLQITSELSTAPAGAVQLEAAFAGSA